MSMFHELMMRKKEEIMYATIKGTLTENDGVFSGFATSNYLQSQNTLNTNNYNSISIKIRFKTPANPNLNTHFPIFSIGNFNLANGISAYMGGSVMFMSVFNNVDYSVNRQLNYDTWYIIDVNIDIISNKVNSTIYNDDKTKKTEFSGNNIPNINDFFFFGKANTNNTIQAIDLPNSYIKLGGTKYNLQAVVGYTIVGSPTITDGVVSGFSNANYLQIAQTFPSVSSISKVQEQVVFTTGTIETQQMIMGGNYGAGTFGFELRTNGKLMFRVTYTDVNNATKYAEVQCDTILTENTKYKAIGKFDLSNLSVNLELYNENNVLIDTKTYTISSSSFNALNTVGDYYLGRHWQRGVFTGSIYLNETYIKLNTKLWFNGQPA